MQQFAIAALAPRSIAWLISADDWAHLESLVAYNCALLGGYFNALIPLTRDGAIDATYERFLLAYDPDLIVLAPDMEQTALEPFLRSHPRLNPFGVVPWDALHLVATRDPRDANSPWMNAPIPLDAPVVALDGPPSIIRLTDWAGSQEAPDGSTGPAPGDDGQEGPPTGDGPDDDGAPPPPWLWPLLSLPS